MAGKNNVKLKMLLYMQNICRFFPLIADCGPFEQRSALAVAVSGGADSMALLLIADAWAKAHGGSAIALTVDHGLRKESADEARQVKAWCEEKGIGQHILTWEHSPTLTGGGIQAAAREARYRLLSDWCKKNNVLHLLTAHHQNDQAETLFFRLGRGSGLDGLACMPSISQLYGIRLLRPLLSVPKTELKALLMAIGQPWIEDPSNQSPRYTRNCLRALIENSGRPAALSQQAADLAQRFGDIRKKNERALAVKFPHIIHIFPDHARLHLKPLLALSEEEAVRLLARLAMSLGGRAMPPRTEKLQRLYRDLSTFRRQRSFGNLMFIRLQKQEIILVRRLEKAKSDSHITFMSYTAKALAGAPFSVKNSGPCATEGARVEHA